MCEVGEGCKDSACNATSLTGGCLQDCPLSAVRCPVVDGMVSFQQCATTRCDRALVHNTGCTGVIITTTCKACGHNLLGACVRCSERRQPCAGHGGCVGSTSGYCQCATGYMGDACTQCEPQFLRKGTQCLFMPGALATCSDGVKSGMEEGVDCGGTCRAPCPTHADYGAASAVSVPLMRETWRRCNQKWEGTRDGVCVWGGGG